MYYYHVSLCEEAIVLQELQRRVILHLFLDIMTVMTIVITLLRHQLTMLELLC
jgi:hypothetical protein